ncbi:MAG: transcriptional repressor LexA [Opitutales bacterium]
MPSKLTQRQREIVTFLETFQREHGMMPTCQEIADAFGFGSPNAVPSHLRLLEKKGVIERFPGKARGLRLLRVPEPEGIPVLGEIAAGDPILAAEASGEYLPVADNLFAGSDVFALRIRGDSMMDRGIFDGDYAVIHAQTDVDDGEIAAVLRDDEATLKVVLRPDAHSLVLRGANPAFPDIVIREGEAHPRILGKYVGLIRLERRVA